MATTRNDPAAVERMMREHGSIFAACPCGRTDVLLYKRSPHGSHNGPGSDRLTLHDTPAGFGCEHGGKLLSEVSGR